FRHADRRGRAQRAKLLTPLYVLGCFASFDDAIALTRKEFACGLSEKDQSINPVRTRHPLELLNYGPPQPAAPAITGDNHRPHQSCCPEPLQSTGGDDSSVLEQHRKLRF